MRGRPSSITPEAEAVYRAARERGASIAAAAREARIPRGSVYDSKLEPSGPGTRWPREVVLQRIQEWHGLYGQPPVASDWLPALAIRAGFPERAERFRAGDWPPYSTVVRRFGSWNAAIEAAGFAPRRARG